MRRLVNFFIRRFMEYFEQLHSGIRLLQPDGCFRMSTDSVLVSHFMTLRPGMRIADLGSGSGNIAFLLAGRRDDCTVTGFELQQAPYEAALRNIQSNNLSHRITMRQADLRQIRKAAPPCSFDAAVSNPPYFPAGSGKASASELLNIARSEQCCDLQQLCVAAAWLVRTGGSFALVHKPERLCDLMCSLRSVGLEPKRLQFVRHHEGAEVSLVLLESRRGGNPGLKMEPDLILFQPDGTPTAQYLEIYHMHPATAE